MQYKDLKIPQVIDNSNISNTNLTLLLMNKQMPWHYKRNYLLVMLNVEGLYLVFYLTNFSINPYQGNQLHSILKLILR